MCGDGGGGGVCGGCEYGCVCVCGQASASFTATDDDDDDDDEHLQV